MTDLNNHYDAIFIGSGIGPMTAPSLLARRKGWRCLILERHYRPGGFAHAFERKKWRWDVGVHYIGGMVHGDVLYQLLNYLSDGALQWTKMPSFLKCLSIRTLSSECRTRRGYTGIV